MGDLNLNPRKEAEILRIKELCQEKLEMALKEDTTTDFNQIDHILIHKRLRGSVFVASYYNFLSNHKTIVTRIGVNGNKLKDEVIQRLKYTSEKFMKTTFNPDLNKNEDKLRKK